MKELRLFARKSRTPIYKYVAFCLIAIGVPILIYTFFSSTLFESTFFLWNPTAKISSFYSSSGKEQLISSKEIENLQKKIDVLTIEKNQLEKTLIHYQTILKNEIYLQKRWEQITYPVLQEKGTSLFKEHLNNLQLFLASHIYSIPAQIIYRSPTFWNNYFWINVGNVTNEKKKIKHIALHSPVIIGDTLIGIVDYVGKRQSRVRLLTDTNCHPSVRAIRGKEQQEFLFPQVEALLTYIEQHKNEIEDHTLLSSLLEKLSQHLKGNLFSSYFAKGELHGAKTMSFKAGATTLIGSGFNYDFGDDFGEAKDLRTGKTNNFSQELQKPIIQIGDLLVTTGLDGLFPPNLKVGYVSKVLPLKEGDYYYNIEAKSCFTQWDQIETVYVLSPSSFEFEDKPQTIIPALN